MILGDSLSLWRVSREEQLRGKVQMIYIDPVLRDQIRRTPVRRNAMFGTDDTDCATAGAGRSGTRGQGRPFYPRICVTDW